MMVAQKTGSTKIAVITGGSAGVGRATVEVFARAGWDVGILARGPARLAATANTVHRIGRRACAIAADVADADAVEEAATRIEQTLGPIDVWVNNAMATVFSPVAQITPEEFWRGTQVTYLGQVHGTMAALRRMRARNRGTIVNVGSALSYRAIPLQSVYCGAKYAVRGFTDSLRSELLHDNCAVHLTMVHLPAVNTPQFDWALNRMPQRPQPVPPIFQPEVAARAILFAATHRRREVWVGWPTVKAIVAGKLIPGLLDRYLAGAGYSGQLAKEPEPPDSPANLFAPAHGNWGAHGRFDASARGTSWQMWISRHRPSLAALAIGLCGIGLGRLAARAGKR
ncbi:MAG TPA: SDR family oxidoreductase [Acetobacteraceae bacterium]|nr:SDR family oxidoreductase [Acetobacteraceae bacterium]